MKNNIPVILGPTASGKTSVGIELAKHINGEIISVDSRKVYQGLPVGTATPNGEWKDGIYYVKGVAHYLMSFLSPDKPYTAGDFAKEADALIKKIRERGKTPILAGGTGFYFKALQKGLPSLPNRDQAFRDQLNDRIEKEGLPVLYKELCDQDPDAAQSISDKDPHKIIRALEVIHITGNRFSKTKEGPRNKSQENFVVIGLDYSKEFLEDRIRQRSQFMLDHGMIDETEALLNKGFSPDCPALASFGYREAVQVVEGKLTREAFLQALIKGTISYAKRQRTWFRTQTPPDHWVSCEPTSQKEAIALIMKDFL